MELEDESTRIIHRNSNEIRLEFGVLIEQQKQQKSKETVQF